MEKKVQQAIRKAQETGRTHYVIDIDGGEFRRLSICDDDYLDTGEYVAFDGRIVATCHANGEVEY